MAEKKKRKPGNPNMKKGAPSINPRGRGSARDAISSEVISALRDSFHEVGGKDYLVDMALNDRRTFAALIAKVIPTDIQANVTHTIIDLGAAMREAETRMAEMQSIIDVTPEHLQPERVSDQSGERETLQPIDLKEKA